MVEQQGAASTMPGWYQDPRGQGLRWWDGTGWTEHWVAARPAFTPWPPPQNSSPGWDEMAARSRRRTVLVVGVAIAAAIGVIVSIAVAREHKSEKAAVATHDAPTPEGFRKVSNETEGVSIAVPEGFTEVDPTAATALYGSLPSPVSKIVLIAADRDNKSGTGMVIVTEADGEIDLQDADLSSELESEFGGYGSFTASTVELPAGEAVRVDGELSSSIGFGGTNLTIYIINASGQGWSIMVMSSESSSLADQAGQTFTVK